MRYIEAGLLLRYMHANEASMFLVVVHVYSFYPGLYRATNNSPNAFVWCLGVVIFLFMIVTNFIRYILP